MGWHFFLYGARFFYMGRVQLFLVVHEVKCCYSLYIVALIIFIIPDISYFLNRIFHTDPIKLIYLLKHALLGVFIFTTWWNQNKVSSKRVCVIVSTLTLICFLVMRLAMYMVPLTELNTSDISISTSQKI